MVTKMKKIKIGIIGAGTWGETHARIFKEDLNTELTAICDLQEEKALSLAKSVCLPQACVYTNHEDMLQHAALDAVAIVTPDFAHYHLAMDCIKAKKHIILEKPLTTNGAEAKHIVQAVKENNVRLMVDLHSRWSPLFALTKEAIEADEIGEVQHAYLRLNDIKYVATDLLPWAEKSSILWFLGYHAVDLLRWLFNDEVERVYSVSRKGVLNAEGVNTDDVFQSILEFKKGGIATLENAWITPNSHPNINDIKLNITGSKGMLNVDPTNSRVIEKFTEHSYEQPDYLVRHSVHGKYKGFAYESIRHFIDQLVSGEDFYVTLEDAYHTTIVVQTLLESAKTRTPIVVEY